MNILFIYRDKHFIANNFEIIFQKNLCRLDFGFFLLGLKTIATVQLISLKDFIKLQTKIKYDHVVIDSKIRVDYNEKEYINYLKNNIKTKVSIFLSYDIPVNMEHVYYFEKYLNVNSYFIPNLLKNLDNYNIDSSIKNKFYQTHYGLGSTEIPYDLSKKKFIFSHIYNQYDTNLFFSGKNKKGKIVRTKIIEDLLREKNISKMYINYYNDENENENILSLKEYIEATQKTKINLVLAGKANNITFRFYEVLFLKAFFLIDPHFTNFKISESFESINDFVFYNYKDLVDKIRFYLDNYERAILIKDMQCKIFKNIYNPIKHGNFLKKIIVN